MDPLFVARQPAPPPNPSNVWQNVAISGQLQHPPDMEYHFANASHTFSSPPSTPMTPIPHHLQHGGFPITHVDPALHHGSLVLYNVPTDAQQHQPPALSHPNWPPEYRLYALCQELQQYPTTELLNEEASVTWWDRFMIEYFHDSAMLVIEIDFGEGMQRYPVNREYIPWYFKSILHENGVSRYNMLLGDRTIHSIQPQIQRILCTNAVQELDYITPHQTKVCCQGQLLVDFTIEDKPRVLHWVYHVVNHVELIPRFCLHAAGVDSCLSNNITRKGLPAATQALLLQLNQPNNNTASNVGPVVRESLPQLTIYPQESRPSSAAWETKSRIDIPTTSLQSTDCSNILSHPPLHHMNTSPPPLTNPLQLSISVPPTSNSSPVTSPIVSVNSNGSTCSISSCTNSNQPPSVPPQPQSQIHVQSQCQTQSQTHSQTHIQPQSMKALNVSSKKTIICPPARPHKFLVAMEPAYFNENMVIGDERQITRVENNLKTTPIPSTTPTSTQHNDSIPSLSWLDTIGNNVSTWHINPQQSELK